MNMRGSKVQVRERDQAETLRALGMRNLETGERPAHVIAITSGKGGVGKTNITASLAMAMERQGLRVLVLDGDLGLANLDIALGVTPRATLLDLLEGQVSIEHAVTRVSDGVSLLAGCSGRFDLANLTPQERYCLFSAIDPLERDFDVLLIDTGAGIGSNAVELAGAAQTVVVVGNDEPTSLADAYAMIKVVASRSGVSRFGFVANMVRTESEGRAVYGKLSSLVDRFLGVRLRYLGAVHEDRVVPRCLRKGVPFFVSDPGAAASVCVEDLARRLMKAGDELQVQGGISLFWKRLVGWRAES